MSDSQDRNMDGARAHPDEQLAGYVDGTLTPEERAEVERHLATCQTCRNEVGLARRAHAALSALPELDVPMGTTRPFVDAARRERRGWLERSSRATWAVGAAAAAAVIAVLAVIALNAGGGGQATTAGSAAAAGVTGATGATGAPRTKVVPAERVIHQEADYDAASIESLATRIASRGLDSSEFGPVGSGAAPAAPVPTPSPATPLSGQSPAPAANPPPDPLACVQRQAGTSSTTTLLRLISARYEGQPAYIGVFAERPDPAAKPTLVTVWVVSAADCTLLNYSSATISR